MEQAREDIVDMRKGRMPSRTEALGWTEQGAFVYRRTACSYQDLSDIPGCQVTIDVAERGKTKSQLLFSAEWAIGCGEGADPALDCWKISTEDASKFLAAERALRESLGTLRPGIPSGRRLGAGRIIGVRYEDQPADRRRAAIAVENGGRWRALRVIWSVETGKDEFLRKDPSIAHVERSPEGASLAIVSELSHAEDDYYWLSQRVDVLPAP